jgi:hypothetical protein
MEWQREQSLSMALFLTTRVTFLGRRLRGEKINRKQVNLGLTVPASSIYSALLIAGNAVSQRYEEKWSATHVAGHPIINQKEA